MESILVKAGLTKSQSIVYLYLLEHGSSLPKDVAAASKLSRPNAYKVLERLRELGLVNQLDVNKKIVFQPRDPASLASLVARERKRIAILEQDVSSAMQELQKTYRSVAAAPHLELVTGKQNIIDSYTQEAKSQKVYFIKSRADIPFMGYNVMHRIRMLASQTKQARFGITPHAPEVPTDPKSDQKTNLTRTLMPEDAYTAPVEWSTHNDTLHITVFENEGKVIKITEPAVADAFKQLWRLIDNLLKEKNFH